MSLWKMIETAVFIAILAVTNAISGGHDTNITKHIWQTSLRYNDNHICGAVLIHERWGLTTASCVDQLQPQDLSVRVASSNLTPKSQTDGFTVQIEYYIIHPRYNRRTYDSDIALLYYNRNITEFYVILNKLPSCLTCDVEEASSTTITGWGSLEPNGPYSDVLQMGHFASMSRGNCQIAYPSTVITLNMFCAGFFHSTSMKINACNGDFGGPVVVTDGVFSNRIEGLMSWGSGCGTSAFPTVMTRVAPFMNWISEHTGVPIQ